jgi:hypothetical protein
VFGANVIDAKKVVLKNSKPFYTVKPSEKPKKGDPCINPYRLSLMENRAVRVATKTAIRAELSRTAPIAYLSGLWVFPIDLQCVYSKPVVRNSLANHLEGTQWEKSLDNLTRQMPLTEVANVPGRVGIIFYPDRHFVPDVDLGMFLPDLEGILDEFQSMTDTGGVGLGNIWLFFTTYGDTAGQALLRAAADKITENSESEENEDDEGSDGETGTVVGSCKPPLFCMDFTEGLDSNSWNAMIESYSLVESSLEHGIGAALPSGGAMTDITMVFDNAPAIELTMK